MSRQHKGSKKRNKRRQKSTRERDLIFADDNQQYAVVLKMLGNGRCSVKCANGVTAIGIIRGKMKFRAWVHLDDLLLVSERDYQGGKVDIIHVYSPEHARIVKEHEQIFSAPVVEESSTDEIEIDFTDI